MRIIGGAHRGLALASVGKGDAAAHLRPTTDRVRESLFNLLAGGGHGPNPVPGAQVLDLFAGTGALGLEALSRGAARVSFVEKGDAAARLIRENIAKCRAQEITRLLRRDARRLGENSGAAHDLVFLDPPYGKALGEAALAAALDGGWIAPGALVVWEESVPPQLPAGLIPSGQRRYGDTWITLARVAEA
ncbi:16S rRNA (guanine(966)-N(2))-methyltransferase RsmD [Profundibacterium mesophilum]|uniref:Trans-aconitate 2-methyltransferase n=1 Tax=Profundibacterium mesophilum KAUST100406-0324 TaxID=1037889 RepID=A0A921NSR3_9RHOB|nr:16S rRNA (guanine(966)-N(2))-methyltransferase RsmD [Profundibacterium mesophilum]KAF0677315.1 trans-aconitate 2-methyltransferase [Profundibacterium mesophilum KAUST100406-0324]